MEITRKTFSEVPEDHVLLETQGRVHYTVPAELLSGDMENRMRGILQYLMDETGLTAEFVMEDIFLDDKAAPTIRGTKESSSSDEFFSIHTMLEDEMGL